MPSYLCEYKALVNAYKCEITEKSHFLVVNGYKKLLFFVVVQYPPWHVFGETMIKIIETNEDNILGIEVIGGYSNADVEELIQNIDKKISEGNERLNFLFKIDKIKYGKREFAAFYKDGKSYAIKNLKNIRHIAVVGHSRLEKVLIELDNKTCHI